jgi:hypothetical protein
MGKSTPPKKRDKDKNKSSESISIKIPASAWRSVAILSASIVMILYVHTSLAPALPSMSEIFMAKKITHVDNDMLRSGNFISLICYRHLGCTDSYNVYYIYNKKMLKIKKCKHLIFLSLLLFSMSIALSKLDSENVIVFLSCVRLVLPFLQFHLLDY